MHHSTALDANIRRHAATRARELGGAPREDDVDIVWAALETPPGARLFRARWVDRSGERALTGVCLDGDIDSRPLDAIDRLLRRWHETTGRLPDVSVAAAVSAFLLDADRRHRGLLGPTADWSEAVPAPLRAQLHGPVYIGGAAELPLVFWWLDAHDSPVRIEIGRDRDSRIAFSATPLQAWVDRESGDRGDRHE